MSPITGVLRSQLIKLILELLITPTDLLIAYLETRHAVHKLAEVQLRCSTIYHKGRLSVYQKGLLSVHHYVTRGC